MLKRALAVVLIVTTLVVPVVGAPPVAAEPIRTMMVGQTAASSGNSSCPVGEVVTEIRVPVVGVGNEPVGLQVVCTPAGQFAAYVGSGDIDSLGTSACPGGEVAVGLHGRLDDRVVRLGAVCSSPSGDPVPADSAGGSGGTPFEARCAEGSLLRGLEVWFDTRVRGLRGICVVPTETILTATPAVRYPGQAVTVTSAVAPTPSGLPLQTGMLELRLDGVEVTDPVTTTGLTTFVGTVGWAPVLATSSYSGDDVYAPSAAVPIDVGPTVLTPGHGTEPMETTRAASGCPTGSAVTGIRWHLTVTEFIAGVYVSCSDGSTGEYAGGNPEGGSSPSDCQPGEVAVGFATTSGDVVDSGRTRCDGPAVAPYSAEVVGIGGGNDNGVAACPADTVLQALVVTWAPYFGSDAVRTIQGVCGDVADPTISARPLPTTLLGTSTTYRWSAADVGAGLDTFEVALADSAYDTTTVVLDSERQAGTTKPLTGLELGHTYCTGVIARDLVGNLSAPAPTTCTTRPVDDRAATASKAWKRTKPRTSFNRTATVTTTKAATLKLATKALLERVGVVATTCKACGSITVFVGKKKIGTLSLRSATTKHQRVLLLPAFAPRKGPVRLVVASSKKSVAIDGIVARTVTPLF